MRSFTRSAALCVAAWAVGGLNLAGFNGFKGVGGGTWRLIVFAGVSMQQGVAFSSNTNIPRIHEHNGKSQDEDHAASAFSTDTRVRTYSEEDSSAEGPSQESTDDLDGARWVKLSASTLKFLQSIEGFFVETQDFPAELLWKQHKPDEGQVQMSTHTQRRGILDTSSSFHSATEGTAVRDEISEGPTDDEGFLHVYRKDSVSHEVHLTRLQEEHIASLLGPSRGLAPHQSRKKEHPREDVSGGGSGSTDVNGGSKGQTLETRNSVGFVGSNRKGDVASLPLTQRRMATTVLNEAALNTALANNAEIELFTDITLTATVTISGLTGLVINGRGYKVDGNNAVICFSVLTDAEVSFIELTITNGYTDSTGNRVRVRRCFNCFPPFNCIAFD